MPTTLDQTPAEAASDKTKTLLEQFSQNWIQKTAEEPRKKEEVKKLELPKLSDEPEVVVAKVEAKEKEVVEKVAEEVVKEPAKPAEAPALDGKSITESIVSGVKEGVREAMQQERQAAAPKSVQEPVDKPLPPVERKRMERLAILETMYPEDYKGIANERNKFLVEQLAYEKGWLKENPGQDFDANAEEHETFFSKDPLNRVDAEHMTEAALELRFEAERAETKRKMEAMAMRPFAKAEGNRAASHVAEALGGKEAAGLLNEDGSFNSEKMAALKEKNPVSAAIIGRAVQDTNDFSSEVVRLFRGIETANPDENKIHRKIMNFGSEVEGRMRQMKPDQWRDPRGRKYENFVPSVVFHKLSAEKQGEHWTFDEIDFINLITLDLQENAKETMEFEEKRFEDQAKRRGYQSATTVKLPETPRLKVSEDISGREDKPVSPGSALQPKLAGVKGAHQQSGQTLKDAWALNWIGK